MITMRRAVEVDGKVRTDNNYPTGFMDVVRIQKTDEVFRVLYDVKGRFVLNHIEAAEANFKLLRISNVNKAKKGTIGRNPGQVGQAGTVPYVNTHDGRTIRYPDPLIKKNDTVKFDLKTGKIVGHLKFDLGNMAMVTKGANIGRVGIIQRKEKHPGSFDIVHLQDKKGNAFATRSANVFVIGEGDKAWISLPKAKGLRSSILEERAERAQAKVDKKAKAAKKANKKDS